MNPQRGDFRHRYGVCAGAPQACSRTRASGTLLANFLACSSAAPLLTCRPGIEGLRGTLTILERCGIAATNRRTLLWRPAFPGAFFRSRRGRHCLIRRHISWSNTAGHARERRSSSGLGHFLPEEAKMDELIHRAGQEAARHGVPLSACPFMQAANMPAHTGESPHKWRVKLASWEAGWREGSDARLADLKRRHLQRLSD